MSQKKEEKALLPRIRVKRPHEFVTLQRKAMYFMMAEPDSKFLKECISTRVGWLLDIGFMK